MHERPKHIADFVRIDSELFQSEKLPAAARAFAPHVFISRVAEHGRRRAAEMREVCDTLREGGVEPEMSDACARVRDRFGDSMAARALDYEALLPFDWTRVLDLLNDQPWTPP
ncbi:MULTISPECIES: DUF1932 domain-containing protein [unclassified Burkholderia]|uniref:DUF1932 domain-containing protein n=1 Tax=unclassified Burkholderia TaxID=2613784 RepID=UPI00214F81EE|nr:MULTISPECIES: DUF1932 domain-containing protein [unclassified Burkholderia]MCR4471481.1 DUF1932 domain-containing protein [Burkholderia sp. SCN-KJ]